MPLFPDRSLASASSRELALVSPGLTDEQKKQLASVTDGYLKSFRLIGFENTRAAIPVVKECIIDGLKARHKRENILPGDDLENAFKRGYSQRNAVIRVMESELAGVTPDAKFNGALALPQEMVRAASSELRGKVFLPKLKAGQQLAEVSKTRRPIFQKVVAYCRDRIEADIPGSDQVKLTAAQETGLVRNLVFGWIALGEPRPLLETEDFMAHRQAYLREIAQKDPSLVRELAQLVGQNSPQALSYLEDLSTQVADSLGGVPEKPSTGNDALQVASAMDTAFKNLDRHFLVVNPFNKFPSLSEDPRDIGRSIWDDGRTTSIVVNGKRYRVPTLATMHLAAFLVSGTDPQHSQQLRSAGAHINSLIAEVARQDQDPRIPDLRTEIAQDKRSLDEAKETIEGKKIPTDGAMSHADILLLAQRQNRLMTDEMQFFPTVKGYHNFLTDLGVNLLRRYQSGEPVKGDKEFNELMAVHYAPGILRERVYHFFRERLSKRVRALEDMLVYQTFTGAMAGDANYRYLETKFTESLQPSVLDILSLRNQFWLNQYRQPNPDLPKGEAAAVWSGIIALEKRHAEAEINKKAERRAAMRGVNFAMEKARIQRDSDDPHTRRLAYAESLQAAIGSGVLPNDAALFQSYLKRWREGGERKIETAIREWTNDARVTLPLQDDFDKEDAGKFGDSTSLRQKAEIPNGPLGIVLNAMTRIAPQQLWPDYPVILEDVAHRVFPEDPSDPFAFVHPGREHNRQNRLLIYAMMQNWLADNGIKITDETYKDLIKPAAMAELVTSGHAHYRFAAIEDEVQNWFSTQRRKLMDQVRDYAPGFYHTSPEVLIKRREQSLDSKERRLGNLEKNTARKLETRVAEIRQQGLIMPE